jgi:hypothetical protein
MPPDTRLRRACKTISAKPPSAAERDQPGQLRHAKASPAVPTNTIGDQMKIPFSGENEEPHYVVEMTSCRIQKSAGRRMPEGSPPRWKRSRRRVGCRPRGRPIAANAGIPRRQSRFVGRRCHDSQMPITAVPTAVMGRVSRAIPNAMPAPQRQRRTARVCLEPPTTGLDHVARELVGRDLPGRRPSSEHGRREERNARFDQSAQRNVEHDEGSDRCRDRRRCGRRIREAGALDEQIRRDCDGAHSWRAVARPAVGCLPPSRG